MLTGLLITLNILVCVALIGVVLLQRSEGGGFVSGSTSSLITARGAGDLLTRTTWILFGLFMALSLGLTLLGAHDRTTSSLAEKLKQQHANIGALGQTNSATPQAPMPASSGPTTPGPAGSTSPFLAPPLSAPPAAAPVPSATPAANPPAKRPGASLRGPARAAAQAPGQGQSGSAAPAAPLLVAPPPQPAPRTLSAPSPKTDPNAPSGAGTP
jgi:preprotein translocase subunit SecG